MKLKSILIAFLTIFFVVIYANAQEPEPKKTEKPKLEKFPVEFGGVLWTHWERGFSPNYNAPNTFIIDRAYLMLKKIFNKTYKAVLIWDVLSANNPTYHYSDAASQTYYDPSAGTLKSISNKVEYKSYLKIAYIEGNKSIGPVSGALQMGIIYSPWLSYNSKLNEDYHLTSDPLFETGFDKGYDLGIGGTLKFMEYAALYGTITKGEGYQSIGTEDNDGKAISFRLAITPIKEFSVTGWVHRNKIERSGYNEGYYGAGIAWKSGLIRLGANYVQLYVKRSVIKAYKASYNTYLDALTNTKTDGGDRIIDVWLNMNLKSLTGISVLLWFNFEKYFDANVAYPTQSFTTDSNMIENNYTIAGDTKDYTLFGFGLGYEPIKNVQINAYYTTKKLKRSVDETIAIKYTDREKLRRKLIISCAFKF